MDMTAKASESHSSTASTSTVTSCIEDAEPTVNRTSERQRAGFRSRERLRRVQERQLRQLPFLYNRVEDLQLTCRGLEEELAISRQRVAAFQQETFALRGLVKFIERPELAAAAEKEATRCMLQEEVKELRWRVQKLQREKHLCLRQCEEACGAAEYYKRLCDQLYGELHPTDEMGISAVAMSSSSPANAPLAQLHATDADKTTSTDGKAMRVEATLLESQLKELRDALNFERARSSALEESMRLLHAAVEGTGATAHGLTSSPKVPSTVFEDGQSARSDGRASRTTEAFNPVSGVAYRNALRTRRLAAVLRTENHLLTQRLSEVVVRNVRFVQEIAALKLANTRLLVHLPLRSLSLPSSQLSPSASAPRGDGDRWIARQLQTT